MTVLDTPTPAETARADAFAAARQAMIDSQLRTSGVTEATTIARMRAVPRENFVPEAARAFAYMDRAVPLGEGRYLPAPLVHGMMLQEAAPRMAEKAIVVDGGSGYLAELVRPLVASLTVLTPDEALATARGGKDKADLLLVDGAIEHLPDALAKRLADDGRIVTGLMQDGVSRLARGRKAAGQVVFLPLAEIGIPRLSAFDKPKGWSF